MNDEERKIRDTLDRLCAEIAPSRVILDISEYQSAHVQRVSKEYEGFVNQFELYYETIVNALREVNYIDKTAWPEHRSVQYQFAVHNLKSLYSTFERLKDGFYEDGIILSRTVYESFIKIIYITCYPTEPYRIAAGINEKGKRNFNLTSFLKDELKLEWTEYVLSSSWAHGNWYSVLKEAVEIQRNGQKDEICLKFSDNKKLLEIGINTIDFLLLANLKAILTLFSIGKDSALPQDMIEKIKILIDLKEYTIGRHPSEYWSKVLQDMKDVFEMIKLAESGQDWKKSWTLIRQK